MGCGYGLHQASVGQITRLYPCRRLQMIDSPRGTYYCNPACKSDTTNEEMKMLTPTRHNESQHRATKLTLHSKLKCCPELPFESHLSPRGGREMECKWDFPLDSNQISARPTNNTYIINFMQAKQEAPVPSAVLLMRCSHWEDIMSSV